MTHINTKIKVDQSQVIEQPSSKNIAESTVALPTDQSVSAIKLFGINIIGIDPRLLSSAELSMQIPLASGKNTIIGIDQDARIKVKDGTVATLALKLDRNSMGMLALNGFSLELNHSIVVKNPTASLLPPQGKNSVGTAIADKIVDVKLSKIEIDSDGELFVNGKIRALRMFKTSLPYYVKNLNLPVLDAALLLALGMVPKMSPQAIQELSSSSASQALEFSGQAPALKALDLDIKKLFKSLGVVTKEASYSLKISGDESQLRFAKDNNFFRGPGSPLNIALDGTIDIDASGSIVLVVDPNKSTFSGSLGTYAPGIKAKISHLTDSKPVSVRLHGEIQGEGKALTLDTFTKQEVKTVLPRRKHLQKSVPMPANEEDYNSSFGAKTLDIEASIDAKISFDKGINIKNGKAKAKITAHEPYAKTHERGIKMEGELSAIFNVNKFSYDRNAGINNTRISANFGIHPNEKTVRQFSEIKPVNFHYRARIDTPQKAEITPPPYGITRFLRPIKNFEAHDERVNTRLTKTNIHPIGSKAYFKQVEKIAGIKPKRADDVELLIDGIRSMPKRIALLEAAQDSICFQTLAFKADSSGWEYAEALVRAAKRGVKVRGIIDALGNIETLKDLMVENPIYKYLRENGVEIYLYNGFLEKGLRSILNVAYKNPSLFQESKIQSIGTVAELIRFFEVIANAADRHDRLSTNDRRELREAINIMMGGKEGISPHGAVSELRQAISGNMTSLDEFLLAIKRVGDASYRWHEKYLIVDGYEAIVGGMNVATEYLRGGSGEQVVIKQKEQATWRDSDVYLRGEVVQDVVASFKNNWLHIAKTEININEMPKVKLAKNGAGPYTVGMIQHRPLEDGDHNVTNFLLYNLRTLEPGQKAWFETPYFLPRGALRALQKEMLKAAKRGVDLRILTNSQSTSDFSPLVEAAIFDTRELMRAGVRVFERKNDRMVHAKVYVLGDKLTMVGSWNMDNRSAAHDSEGICAIFDEEITKDMQEHLMLDMFDQSDELTLDHLENRNIGQELRSATMLMMGELI